MAWGQLPTLIVEGVDFELCLTADLVDLGREQGQLLAQGLNGGAFLVESVVQVWVLWLDAAGLRGELAELESRWLERGGESFIVLVGVE